MRKFEDTSRLGRSPWAILIPITVSPLSLCSVFDTSPLIPLGCQFVFFIPSCKGMLLKVWIKKSPLDVWYYCSHVITVKMCQLIRTRSSLCWLKRTFKQTNLDVWNSDMCLERTIFIFYIFIYLFFCWGLAVCYYSQVCKSYKSTLKSVKFVILVWFTIGLIHCLMIFLS